MIEGKLCLTTVDGTGRQFVAQSGTGHAFVMDDADGRSGPKPIEFALLALGGCTAFDVISILRRSKTFLSLRPANCTHLSEVREMPVEAPPSWPGLLRSRRRAGFSSLRRTWAHPAPEKNEVSHD